MAAQYLALSIKPAPTRQDLAGYRDDELDDELLELRITPTSGDGT